MSLLEVEERKIESSIETTELSEAEEVPHKCKWELEKSKWIGGYTDGKRHFVKHYICKNCLKIREETRKTYSSFHFFSNHIKRR